MEKKMTREELQQKLRELQTRKQNAIREHDERLLDITEAQQKTLADIADRQHVFMLGIKKDKRNCDSIMRKANMEENTRFKLEKMAIANDERQLFADYKAQGNDDTDVSPDSAEEV